LGRKKTKTGKITTDYRLRKGGTIPSAPRKLLKKKKKTEGKNAPK